MINFMGRKNSLQWGSCASDIYHILLDSEHLTLQELYKKLDLTWAKSSVRRSLYELRDNYLVYKVEPNIWYFDKKSKPMKIVMKN